jgi:hypothetical protein
MEIGFPKVSAQMPPEFQEQTDRLTHIFGHLKDEQSSCADSAFGTDLSASHKRFRKALKLQRTSTEKG